MDVINKIIQSLPRTPHELANTISTVPMAPYFICIHYCLVALTMRKRAGARDYARDHPFASWFVYVVACFGGSVICSFLMAKPILHVFYLNSSNIILLSFVWYLVLFSPFEIVYKLTNIKLVKAVLLALKEVHRIHMIRAGVQSVITMYPRASQSELFFIAVLIGSIRGSGAKFLLRPLDSIIRGNLMSDNEFLKPTFSTKHAVVSSVLILLQKTGTLKIDEPMLLMYLVLFASTIQLAILLFDIKDPYSIIGDLVAAIFIRLPDELVREDTKKKTD